MIDNLLYQYEDNRLVSVHDAIANTDNGYGNFDFTDGTFQATEYVYDANGNMIQDLNKGITNITYNHLNLPEQITINGNTVEFIYDANGIRHHKITNDNVNISNDYYDGNFHYGEQELDFILTSEGRIVPPSNSVDNYHRYEYHYTDHQNNLRLAYSDLDGDNKIDPNTEVLQSQDYYPFGMEHQGYQPPLVQIGAAHQYTFQGQLKHEDFGLNVSQYKWRNTMPDLGRFFNVDPLSEQYLHNSTYAFSENRLIDGVELEGLEFVKSNESVVYWAPSPDGSWKKNIRTISSMWSPATQRQLKAATSDPRNWLPIEDGEQTDGVVFSVSQGKLYIDLSKPKNDLIDVETKNIKTKSGDREARRLEKRGRLLQSTISTQDFSKLRGSRASAARGIIIVETILFGLKEFIKFSKNQDQNLIEAQEANAESAIALTRYALDFNLIPDKYKTQEGTLALTNWFLFGDDATDDQELRDLAFKIFWDFYGQNQNLPDEVTEEEEEN